MRDHSSDQTSDRRSNSTTSPDWPIDRRFDLWYELVPSNGNTTSLIQRNYRSYSCNRYMVIVYINARICSDLEFRCVQPFYRMNVKQIDVSLRLHSSIKFNSVTDFRVLNYILRFRGKFISYGQVVWTAIIIVSKRVKVNDQWTQCMHRTVCQHMVLTIGLVLEYRSRAKLQIELFTTTTTIARCPLQFIMVKLYYAESFRKSLTISVRPHSLRVLLLFAIRRKLPPPPQKQ